MISWNDVLLGFLGGLAIFIFGLNFLTDGLKQVAGKKMRSVVAKYTKNPISGLLFGFVLTLMLQSSTGSIAIVVSLISAGALKFKQSLPVLLGANIGSSITYLIIGFKIGNYALYIIALGVFMYTFMKRTNSKKYGQVLFGFGLMFYGLHIMSGGIAPLKNYEPFLDFVKMLGKFPLFGVVIGAIFTAIVHSSAATMGILQTLFEQGAISFSGAWALALGAGIGTTMTAVSASMHGSKASQKTAIANVIYNVLGTIVFLIIMVPFKNLFGTFVSQAEPGIQIALYMLIYRIISAIVFLPLNPLLIKVLDKRIDESSDQAISPPEEFFDEKYLTDTDTALKHIEGAMIYAAELSIKSCKNAKEFLNTSDITYYKKLMEIEDVINIINYESKDFLIKVARNAISAKQLEIYNFYYQTITEIERVGDLCKNVVVLKEVSRNKYTKFTVTGTEEINVMFDRVFEILGVLVEVLKNGVLSNAHDSEMYDKLRSLYTFEEGIKKGHYERMVAGAQGCQSSVIYIEIVNNLDRIGNHCFKIMNNKLKVKIN